MTIELLKSSYQNATSKSGLIAFTEEVRGPMNDNQGKYSVTSERLASLFASRVWRPISKSGGHLKFVHRVTGTVVDYKNHGLSSGVDPGAVLTILGSVQEVLNTLGNDIFNYTDRNWKKEPDYQEALIRMNRMKSKAPCR